MRSNVEIEWPAGDTGARVLGASAHHNGPIARVLMSGLSLLYRSGVALRNKAYDVGLLRSQRVSVPIISIGNIVAGGAGKTPFTKYIVGELTGRGRRVAIVHGGYGSDEPALHRQWHEAELVIEERNRVRAATSAALDGVDVVVLDDAFQHRRLARDLDIVLVPAETKSRKLLPAGPLREPERGLRRADLIVVTRKTASEQEAAAVAQRLRLRFGKPCAIAALQPLRIRSAHDASATPPRKFVIVTAIARPDLLVDQVAAMRVEVERTYAYPDHHAFTTYDLSHIMELARGTPILSTEKDAIKLLPLGQSSDLWILEQRVAIEQGGDALQTFLERVL